MDIKSCLLGPSAKFFTPHIICDICYIPYKVSFQIDVFIREFSFTTMQIVGSILSVTALVILLLPVPEKTKPEEEKKVNLSDCDGNDNMKDEILTDL